MNNNYQRSKRVKSKTGEEVNTPQVPDVSQLTKQSKSFKQSNYSNPSNLSNRTNQANHSNQLRQSRNKEVKSSKVSKVDLHKISRSKSKDVYGDINIDIPRKIISGEKSPNNCVILNIEWIPRKDGIIPKRSKYTSLEFLEKHAKMLVEFYESKIMD